MIDLETNDYLLRAAWTAMDQTYGDTVPGRFLQPIDNSAASDSPARTQPFSSTSNFVVFGEVLGQGDKGQKFTVYLDKKSGYVMLVPTGTMGNSDGVGWVENFADEGQSQWLNFAVGSDPLNSSIRVSDAVFDMMNRAASEAEVPAKLIFAGDSKGGAIAQFALNTYARLSNEQRQLYPALTWDANDIALIVHSAPGVMDILEPLGYTDNSGFDKTWFNNVAFHATATRLLDETGGSFEELVSRVGGAYLTGGPIRYMNVVNTTSILDSVMYAHRIAKSGWDYFYQGGTISALQGAGSQEARDVIRTDLISHIQSLAGRISSYLAGNGNSNKWKTIGRGLAIVGASLPATPLQLFLNVLRGETSPLQAIGLFALATVSVVGQTVSAAAVLVGTALIGTGALSQAPSDVIYDAQHTSASNRNRTGAPVSPPSGFKELVNYMTVEGNIIVMDQADNGALITYQSFLNVRSIVSIQNNTLSASFGSLEYYVDQDGVAYISMPDGSPAIVMPNGASFVDMDHSVVEFKPFIEGVSDEATYSVIGHPDGSLSIKLKDLFNTSELKVSRQGVDLVISDGTVSATINDWFKLDGSGFYRKIDLLSASGAPIYDAKKLTELALEQWGTDAADTLEGLGGYTNTLHGGSGNDILRGKNGLVPGIGDTFEGGTGNDTIYGSKSDDTYIYNKGDGADVIFNEGGQDILVLRGLKLKDAIISGPQGYRQDLFIDFGDGNSITWAAWFSNLNPATKAALVQFDDITLKREQLEALALPVANRDAATHTVSLSTNERGLYNSSAAYRYGMGAAGGVAVVGKGYDNLVIASSGPTDIRFTPALGYPDTVTIQGLDTYKFVWASGQTVAVQLTTTTGSPPPKVSLAVLGTTYGTTGLDGNFVLQGTDGSTLQVIRNADGSVETRWTKADGTYQSRLLKSDEIVLDSKTSATDYSHVTMTLTGATKLSESQVNGTYTKTQYRDNGDIDRLVSTSTSWKQTLTSKTGVLLYQKDILTGGREVIYELYDDGTYRRSDNTPSIGLSSYVLYSAQRVAILEYKFVSDADWYRYDRTTPNEQWNTVQKNGEYSVQHVWTQDGKTTWVRDVNNGTSQLIQEVPITNGYKRTIVYDDQSVRTYLWNTYNTPVYTMTYYDANGLLLQKGSSSYNSAYGSWAYTTDTYRPDGGYTRVVTDGNGKVTFTQTYPAPAGKSSSALYADETLMTTQMMSSDSAGIESSSSERDPEQVVSEDAGLLALANEQQWYAAGTPSVTEDSSQPIANDEAPWLYAAPDNSTSLLLQQQRV